MGVFDRIFAALAAASGAPDRLMLDATHLKAHRTAASLLKGGATPAASAAWSAGKALGQSRGSFKGSEPA